MQALDSGLAICEAWCSRTRLWLRLLRQQLGTGLGAPTPDENTIRLFREKLKRVGAIEMLFPAFDRQLREGGYLPMGAQIVDATQMAAPKQRNTAAEKQAIKRGARVWPGEPAKAAQKDTDARLRLTFARQKDQMGLFICTICFVRAETKIGLANCA